MQYLKHILGRPVKFGMWVYKGKSMLFCCLDLPLEDQWQPSLKVRGMTDRILGLYNNILVLYKFLSAVYDLYMGTYSGIYFCIYQCHSLCVIINQYY